MPVWICPGHPTTIPAIPSEGIDSWFIGHILGFARAIKGRAVDVQFPAECVDGYLKWYPILSHPRIISPRKHVDDVQPSNARSSHDDDGVPSDGVSPPPSTPHGANDAQPGDDNNNYGLPHGFGEPRL